MGLPASPLDFILDKQSSVIKSSNCKCISLLLLYHRTKSIFIIHYIFEQNIQNLIFFADFFYIFREFLVLEKTHPKSESEREKDNVKEDGIVNSIGNWFNRQSKDSLIGLFLLMIFFYFLGTLRRSK